ncbi:Uncharacterised protein [Mycobacterium tuberculosis]|nr:Uncharacterised protein [Mycobacterium tuberculosis]
MLESHRRNPSPRSSESGAAVSSSRLPSIRRTLSSTRARASPDPASTSRRSCSISASSSIPTMRKIPRAISLFI